MVCWGASCYHALVQCNATLFPVDWGVALLGHNARSWNTLNAFLSDSTVIVLYCFVAIWQFKRPKKITIRTFEKLPFSLQWHSQRSCDHLVKLHHSCHSTMLFLAASCLPTYRTYVAIAFQTLQCS